MGNSVIALYQGFDYQARWFWIEGLRLLRSKPVLERVAIEAAAPPGFDDVVSYPVIPRDTDAWGHLVGIDGFQAKFHTDQSKAIRATDLSDPAFIRTKTSVLERLRQAVAAADAKGRYGRFTFVTPWRVDRNDLLAQLLGPSGDLRLSVLFRPAGAASETAKLRKTWREHLGLKSDDSLAQLLKHFRILERDLEQTNRELERELEVAGLAPVDEGSATHPYVDLIQGHIKLGELEFDAPALRRSLTAARLWRDDATASDSRRALAIRSRRVGVLHLEDETTDLLDLVPLFHDRDLASGIDWNGDVGRRVAGFLAERVRHGDAYRVYIDAHASVAFAAGWVLHRTDASPMQNVDGRLLHWPSTGAVPPGSLWTRREVATGSSGPDIALALSVARDVERDVIAYVGKTLPQVGLVVLLNVPRVSRTAVRDGAHANALAAEAIAAARGVMPRDGRTSRVHIFSAAPNALVFQLGRQGRPLGHTTIYEFDLENPHRGYSPAISTPIREEVR